MRSTNPHEELQRLLDSLYDIQQSPLCRDRTLFHDERLAPKLRDRAHAWREEFLQLLPGMDVGSGQQAAEFWWRLGFLTYYLHNPWTASFRDPCPEAAACFAEALKHLPEHEPSHRWLRNSSPR